MIKKRRMGASGFSLVELIIAIAILIVLTGLIAPFVLRYVAESRRAKDIQAVDTAVTEAKLQYTTTATAMHGNAAGGIYFYDAAGSVARTAEHGAIPSITGYGLSRSNLNYRLGNIPVNGTPRNAFVRVDLDDQGTVTYIEWIHGGLSSASARNANGSAMTVDGAQAKSSNAYYDEETGTLYLGSPYEKGTSFVDMGWKYDFFRTEGHTSADIKKMVVSPGTVLANNGALAGLFSPVWQVNYTGNLDGAKNGRWADTPYTMKDLEELDLTYLPSNARFNGGSAQNYTDPTSIQSLKTITLPTEANTQGIPLSYGTWAYYDDNGNQVIIDSRTDLVKSGKKVQYAANDSRDQLMISEELGKQLAGKTIYRIAN